MAWAELSDVRCYYELVGEGEPVLLIPGLGTTCRLWDPVAPELAADFSLILADNRNVGRSAGRRRPRTLADFAADLVELLDELQLDRAHVMGISLGGVIAQRLAVDHPDRVDRLVLVSCADRFTPYLRQMTSLLAHSLRRFPREMFVRTIELLGTSPQFLDTHTELVERRVRAKCAAGIGARSLADQLRCLAHSEFRPEDYRITAPTLVIAGEHDVLIPAFYSRRMAGRIPDCRFVLIPGGGHNPLVDYPGRLAPLVAGFLRGREPAGGEGGFDDAYHWTGKAEDSEELLDTGDSYHTHDTEVCDWAEP